MFKLEFMILIGIKKQVLRKDYLDYSIKIADSPSTPYTEKFFVAGSQNVSCHALHLTCLNISSLLILKLPTSAYSL